MCQCAACQAIAKAEESEAGPLLDFVNYLADGILREYSDVWIDTLANMLTQKPPKHVFFQQYQVEGVFMELEYPIQADLWDLKVWMMMRLQVEPGRDDAALRETFLLWFLRKIRGVYRTVSQPRGSVLGSEAVVPEHGKFEKCGKHERCEGRRCKGAME